MCGYTVVAYPIGMCGQNIQVFMGFLNLRLCPSAALSALALWCVSAEYVVAETCYPPAPPFVPDDPATLQQFADLIRSDFETYIVDVQDYFRCLDAERARAFEEAQVVSEEYGRFLGVVER